MTKIVNDVIYDDQKQLATDIYMPAQATTKTKILLFWHGGGWIRGDKSDLKDLCSKIAEMGFTVFVPNYSLAPAHVFPAAHDDCVTFVHWLFKSDYLNHGSNDKKKICQIGASSGGVMALYLAGLFGFPTVTWSAPVNYSDWLKEHQDVKAAVDARSELGLTDPKEINNSFYKYFALTYAGSDDEQTLQKLDAKSYDFNNLQQLLLINSADELAPISYLLNFISTLAKENHAIDLKLIAGNRHAMSYASQYLAQSIAYLNQALA